jgi:hypothetical protein
MIKPPTNLANVKPSASRERSSRAAVIMADYLKANSLGAGPKKLEEIVLSQHPEWKLLQDETPGELSTQSRLTNDIAWGKNALKDGGYTVSIKGVAAGGKERLKMSDKGKVTDFSKKEGTTWEQHFVLIQEGKI